MNVPERVLIVIDVDVAMDAAPFGPAYVRVGRIVYCDQSGVH